MLRMYNNRHWMSDVLAGAGQGAGVPVGHAVASQLHPPAPVGDDGSQLTVGPQRPQRGVWKADTEAGGDGHAAGAFWGPDGLCPRPGGQGKRGGGHGAADCWTMALVAAPFVPTLQLMMHETFTEAVARFGHLGYSGQARAEPGGIRFLDDGGLYLPEQVVVEDLARMGSSLVFAIYSPRSARRATLALDHPDGGGRSALVQRLFAATVA